MIDRLSASQSVNEDVRINFKQSNQCFNALKCQKCAIKIKIKMLTPGLPLLMLSAIVQRAIVQKVKIYVSITEDQSKGRRRRNPEDVRIYFKQLNRCSNALKCQKWTIKKILMLTPGPLVL